MPWRPLPRIAFAVAVYPFQPSSPADLPLELGDELYIIEEGGKDFSWYRGYLVAPPSLLAGLTCVKGQTLEARVFSGIFPRNCVEVREVLANGGANGSAHAEYQANGHSVGTENERRLSNDSKDENQSAREDIGPVSRRKSDANDKDQTPHVNGNGNTQYPEKRSSSRWSGAPSKAQAQLLPITPIPANHQDPNAPRPPAPVPMLKIGDETPTSSSEPLVDEIASCLREWHSTNLHELLLSRRYSVLDKLSKLVQQLDLARRQLLHGVLTSQELDALREKTVWDLVSGNKMLSNEIIIRDPTQRGRLLTGDDPAIEIAKLQSTMSLLDKPPIPTLENVKLHHLMVEFRGLASHVRETPSLVISLFSKKPGEVPKPLTEAFGIDVPLQDQLVKAANMGKLRTLFTDLTSSDIGEALGVGSQLYVVVKVKAHQSTQAASITPSRSGTMRDSRSTKESVGSMGSLGNGSAKGGRRSLMWGQNKTVKAPRHQALQGSSLGQSLQKSGSSPSFAEEEEQEDAVVTRPSTSATSHHSNQQSSQLVKRSVGIAILPLRQFLVHDGDMEQTLTVWSPHDTNSDTQDPEHGWDDVIPELMPSRTKRFEKSKLVNRIRLRFHSFVSPNAASLIRKTPTLLHNIARTPKMGFSGAPTKPRSDIYITLSSPHLPAHALFSHPERGTVQLGSSLDMNNIQLTLEVRKSSGERIEHCIFPSSNSLGLTAWRTTAIARGEAWNQTVKLVIPREDVPNAHVIMSIADYPSFPFALSWMPLWDQQAFVKDGKHSPLLYLYDKVTSNTEQGRGAYLDFPWDSKARDDQPKIESLTGPIAMLRLESYLCSTEFSQDQVLLGVLRWRDQPEDQLLVMLRQLVFVPEIEIVKVVSDVFDALFSILVDRSGNDEYEDLVFNDLVTVLGIVHDRRFNLGPLVNEYAETRFNYPFATPCLIRSYLRLLATPADYQNSRNLRATFKVGREILKFIVTARRQQKVKEAAIGITTTQPTFNRDFKRIFAALESLMREPSPTLIGSKTLVVQHMHTWLPELTECFTQEEIMQIAVSFINSCDGVKGKLVLHKLVLILNLTKVVHVLDADLRPRFATTITSWISPYWGSTDESMDQYREQVRLCCSIAATQIHNGGFEFPYYFVKIIESYRCLQLAKQNLSKDIVTLLFPTVYPFHTKPVATKTSFDENLIELSALLAGFSAEDLAKSTEPLGPGMADILSAALEVNMSILSGEAFPSTWLTLHVYHHRSILQLLEALSEIMEKKFLPSPDDADDFNTELWKTFLTTLLKLVRSEALALETFPEQKRRAVWKIAGDVREQGAALLERCWDAIGWEASPDERTQYGLFRLGGYQVQYVPSLVAPIVELCMSVHEGLRSVAVKILQTMIVSEWTLNEDLSVVQAEIIDCLDHLFKTRDISESAQQKLFVTELLDLFEPLARSTEDPLWEAIKKLVSTVDELLDLLVAVHNTDTTKAFQIMHTLRLMDFLKGMQKEDIYIRYVHQLADVQSQSRNATEAGLALRLHADLYTWDLTRTVDALSSPAFPKQSAFERKESLYFEMIKCFEEGAAWDSALVSYRELAEQYEFVLFDFAKLARTHRSTARIFEIVSRGEGLSPRYFRVVYKGLGFPHSLRDKQFVYEGQGSERLSSFTDRLQQQYPAAQFVAHGDIDDVEGQYLQVTAVNTYRDLDHPLYHRAKVPQSTRDFILSSRPTQFSVTTRRHSPKHNVKDQWIEKTVYTTADTFPTILRRSEIVAVDVVPLSPLQTAVERTTRKTSELAVLEKRIVEGDDSSFFNLTEAIKSSVTPSSTTTVAQYRELLPQPEETEADDELLTEPQFQPLEHALKIALLDFASTLRRCLALYSRPAQQATQLEFNSLFSTTFAPELAVLAPPPGPLPPPEVLPGWSPKPPFTIESSSGDPNLDPTEHLVNGDSHPIEPVVLNGTSQLSTTDPNNASSRSRFSSFLKRTKTLDSQPTSNGVASANSHFPHSDSRSLSSSRATSRSRGQERRNSRVSVKDFGDGHAIGSPASKARSRSDSDTRPMTAKSAATATSTLTGKGGSLRKRLSTLGIGRKPSKVTFVRNGDTLVEEE